MKTIALTRGFEAIVDDEDFEYLSQFKWHFNSHGYAARTIYIKDSSKKSGYKFITERMHRVINKTSKGFHTDHINSNRLDNRKVNLRTATRAQNARNKSNQKNNTSGYKGVSWHARNKRWRASISLNNKPVNIGCFKTKEEAARAYNEAAIRLHGEFSKLNTYQLPNHTPSDHPFR